MDSLVIMDKLILAFILIPILHFIADGVMQAESWATTKSKDLNSLVKHTVTYSLVWLLPMWLMFNLWYAFLFVFTTFVFHTLTDYITSKIVSKKFEKKHYGGPIPNTGGFSFIVLDQSLHYIQLFLTYYYLGVA